MNLFLCYLEQSIKKFYFVFLFLCMCLYRSAPLLIYSVLFIYCSTFMRSDKKILNPKYIHFISFKGFHGLYDSSALYYLKSKEYWWLLTAPAFSRELDTARLLPKFLMEHEGYFPVWRTLPKLLSKIYYCMAHYQSKYDRVLYLLRRGRCDNIVIGPIS